jgi:hypothetical protein
VEGRTPSWEILGSDVAALCADEHLNHGKPQAVSVPARGRVVSARESGEELHRIARRESRPAIQHAEPNRSVVRGDH